MRRFPDWEDRLAAALEPMRLRPFQWGKHDCCTFAADCVLAMTGEDAIAAFRGRYSTAIGSKRALRKFGAGTLEATIDTMLKRVPAPLAQRGDVVMSGGNLGIAWSGFMFAVGTLAEREGLLRVARRDWVNPIAWRVPYEELA